MHGNSRRVPDLFVPDEPTDNRDVRSMDMLTRAPAHWSGTVPVVSHDLDFLLVTGITRRISMKR